MGQRSNRAHSFAARAQAVALITAHFSGSAVPTLRRWMLAAPLWSRVRKSKRAHQRRTRRAHRGELVQMDGSFHAWLEDRGPVECLLTMIDDATGESLGQFTGEETTWGAAEVLQAWIAKCGVPQALYVDAKSVFVRPATCNELAAGIAPVTQFGRMCAKRGIRLIIAKTPEAKGRVERVHGTDQDRLVKKLRRAGIATYAAAVHSLDTTYWAAHNARFAVAPLEPADSHLPLHPRLQLAHVFCLEEPRVVGNDWVVRYADRALQILPTARAKRHTGPRGRILVREPRTGDLLLVARTPEGKEHLRDDARRGPRRHAQTNPPGPGADRVDPTNRSPQRGHCY